MARHAAGEDPWASGSSSGSIVVKEEAFEPFPAWMVTPNGGDGKGSIPPNPRVPNSGLESLLICPWRYTPLGGGFNYFVDFLTDLLGNDSHSDSCFSG